MGGMGWRGKGVDRVVAMSSAGSSVRLFLAKRNPALANAPPISLILEQLLLMLALTTC